MNKILVTLVLLFFIDTSFSQIPNDTLHVGALKALHYGETRIARQYLDQIDSNTLFYKTLLWEINLFEKGENNNSLHTNIQNTAIFNKKDTIYKLIHLGDYHLFDNKQDVAYTSYLKALTLSKKQNDSILVCKTLKKLWYITNKNRKLRKDRDEYIKDYERYAYNKIEEKYVTLYKLSHDYSMQKRITKDSLNGLLEKVIVINNKLCKLDYYNQYGIIYDRRLKNTKKAIVYNTLVLELLKEDDFYYFNQIKKNTFNNLACTYYDQEEYSKALKLFTKAYNIKSTKRFLKNDSIIVNWLSKTHYKLNNIDSAYYYAQKKDSISRELGQATYAANIEEYKRKYDIVKEQKKTLLAHRKRIANRNMSILLIIILSAVLIIGILVYRSLKRKQLLTEREKQLEAEKLEKLLNEQELAGINAMVEGQEKERKRIANELHDDLGSSMATLRLYAENARTKNEQVTQIHDKMLTIIDEVYKRVRGMAHTRNSGVKGSKGLLPAIQLFAQKISDSKQLQVEVTAFGMNTYYESELELEIFRIIKELITNVIKHAEATEVLIQLTQHDNYLNIIVQDDGKGFNVKAIKQTDGMGLYSIEKRIESKNGTMDIDSSFAHGTTIMLNIPSSS